MPLSPLIPCNPQPSAGEEHSPDPSAGEEHNPSSSTREEHNHDPSAGTERDPDPSTTGEGHNPARSAGEHKCHFVPALVGPLLEVTLVPTPELRRATIPVFYDLMQVEQLARGNFKQVSRWRMCGKVRHRHVARVS